MRTFLKCASCIFLSSGLAVLAQDPFTISSLVQQTNGTALLRVAFGVPTNHFLYADKLSFSLGDEPSVESFNLPEPILVGDKFSGKQKRVFSQSFEATRPLPTARTGKFALTVRFQGCDDANCFFPEEKLFTIAPDGSVAEVESDLTAAPLSTSRVQRSRG